MDPSYWWLESSVWWSCVERVEGRKEGGREEGGEGERKREGGSEGVSV